MRILIIRNCVEDPAFYGTILFFSDSDADYNLLNEHPFSTWYRYLMDRYLVMHRDLNNNNNNNIFYFYINDSEDSRDILEMFSRWPDNKAEVFLNIRHPQYIKRHISNFILKNKNAFDVKVTDYHEHHDDSWGKVMTETMVKYYNEWDQL